MNLVLMHSAGPAEGCGSAWLDREAAQQPFLYTREQPDDAVLSEVVSARDESVSVARELWSTRPPGSGMDTPVMFWAAQEPEPGYEDAFYDWMMQEHLPKLCAIDGVRWASWYVLLRGAPRFLALYGLERAEIVETDAWRQPGQTSWAQRLLPHRRSRCFRVFERLARTCAT